MDRRTEKPWQYHALHYIQFHGNKNYINRSAISMSMSSATYKLSKLGQSDLVFGLLSEFISRSMHAGLHKCSSYALGQPG